MSSLVIFAANTVSVARNNRLGHRVKLILTYVRLQLKELLALGLLRLHINHEALFGYSVNFYRYEAFVTLYEQIFLSGDYFFAAGGDAPFILDCGSNIGMSILYFKKLYPKARIIGFEPDRETFAMLKRNVEANRLEDVQLVNKAVSNVDGLVKFFGDAQAPGSMSATMNPDFAVPNRLEKEVFATRLSEYIISPVDFLKLDVEGAEHEVLEELAQTGRLRLIQQMVLEYHHHMDTGEDKLARLLQVLEQAGFGYQFKTTFKAPFPKQTFQALIIYAYRK